MAQASPRWQRRKDARPSEITDAALSLFVDRGYAATRLDDVAKLAGVTKGTVYLYFTNKEELFKAVVRETLLPELALAETLLHEHTGSWEALLRDFIVRWARRMAQGKSSGISKLMIAESANFPELATFYVNEVVSRSRRLFADVIARGIAAGEFRAVDPMMASRAITAPMLMVNIWCHSFSSCDPDTVTVDGYADFHCDMLMHGLKAA
ncbi:TetR/AcrR family transcriptional regulator [Chitinimonas sp.]|uniref:TetR/AcrR family transcriptional regulator n=1 Tax=Chitinimonas sp. TaxID=1934313 RepID=UPI0035B11111